MCEIKPPAVREHPALYQPVRQQVYALLDSLLSTWANISKQERAAVRSSFAPLVISSQGWRMTPENVLLTFVFFPAAFLPPSSPQKRQKATISKSLLLLQQLQKKYSWGILLHCSPIFSQPWVSVRLCSWR